MPRIRLFCCAVSSIKVVGFADDLPENIPTKPAVKSRTMNCRVFVSEMNSHKDRVLVFNILILVIITWCKWSSGSSIGLVTFRSRV